MDAEDNVYLIATLDKPRTPPKVKSQLTMRVTSSGLHKKNVEIDWTWQELEEKEDCEELAKVSYNYF